MDYREKDFKLLEQVPKLPPKTYVKRFDHEFNVIRIEELLSFLRVLLLNKEIVDNARSVRLFFQMGELGKTTDMNLDLAMEKPSIESKTGYGENVKVGIHFSDKETILSPTNSLISVSPTNSKGMSQTPEALLALQELERELETQVDKKEISEDNAESKESENQDNNSDTTISSNFTSILFFSESARSRILLVATFLS